MLHRAEPIFSCRKPDWSEAFHSDAEKRDCCVFSSMPKTQSPMHAHTHKHTHKDWCWVLNQSGPTVPLRARQPLTKKGILPPLLRSHCSACPRGWHRGWHTMHRPSSFAKTKKMHLVWQKRCDIHCGAPLQSPPERNGNVRWNNLLDNFGAN